MATRRGLLVCPTCPHQSLKEYDETRTLPDAGQLLTAQEASAMLGIKPATLYTYVSRGLLHPLRQAQRQANRYLLEELQSLKVRSSVRQGRGPVAAAARRWGQPVIETSITEIEADGPRYRGFLANL
jgi:citrate synthase